ncbi:PIN domain nuclease [Glycomyces albus]
MAAPTYLLDTSAWVHRMLNQQIRSRIDDLWLAGRIATCHFVVAELLSNARDPRPYKSLQSSLIATRWLPVTVLHCDSDYDRIAAITGQPTEWVAPQGSL